MLHEKVQMFVQSEAQQFIDLASIDRTGTVREVPRVDDFRHPFFFAPSIELVKSEQIARLRDEMRVRHEAELEDRFRPRLNDLGLELLFPSRNQLLNLLDRETLLLDEFVQLFEITCLGFLDLSAHLAPP